MPELDVTRIRRWAADRTAAEARGEARIEVDETARGVTIHEARPPWDQLAGRHWIRTPIARLRYVASRREWTLYRPDATGRFRRYDRAAPTRFVADLLLEIDDDPMSVFWR